MTTGDDDPLRGFAVRISDLGPDTRDATIWLKSICAEARAAGVETKGVLEEVAAQSNNLDKHGMGSTRSLLLHAAGG